jgi:hypothetical protein
MPFGPCWEPIDEVVINGGDISDKRNQETSMSDQKMCGVPVVPNASLVRGRILSIKPCRESGSSDCALAVDEAGNVAGLPNFVREFIGKTITVRLPAELGTGFVAQDHLELRISFRADERGGLFTVIDDDIRKV